MEQLWQKKVSILNTTKFMIHIHIINRNALSPTDFTTAYRQIPCPIKIMNKQILGDSNQDIWFYFFLMWSSPTQVMQDMNLVCRALVLFECLNKYLHKYPADSSNVWKHLKEVTDLVIWMLEWPKIEGFQSTCLYPAVQSHGKFLTCERARILFGYSLLAFSKVNTHFNRILKTDY